MPDHPAHPALPCLDTHLRLAARSAIRTRPSPRPQTQPAAPAHRQASPSIPDSHKHSLARRWPPGRATLHAPLVSRAAVDAFPPARAVLPLDYLPPCKKNAPGLGTKVGRTPRGPWTGPPETAGGHAAPGRASCHAIAAPSRLIDQGRESP